MEPYQPRPIRAHGVRDLAGWRLKLYTIVYGDGEPAFEGAEDVWPLVTDALPAPAVARGRPGVGFVILHRGRGVDYAVLGWWDRENELPLRVFVRGRDAAVAWRPARGSESVCVWDLEVIAFERTAYVEAVMASEGPDVEGYLVRQMRG